MMRYPTKSIEIRCFFFSSRRRHTRCLSDWSSDVCSSDLGTIVADINNNTVVNNGTSSFDYGIRGGARAGTGTADLLINNNTAFGEAAGVWFFAGNNTGGETSRTTLNLISNNIDGGPTSFADYFVEQYIGTTFQITGLPAGTGTNAAQVAAYIATKDDDAGAVVDAGSGTTVNYTAGTPAAPLLAAPGGV